MLVTSDITIAAEDARIGQPALELGGGLLSPTWQLLVGPKRAKEMSFTIGGWISGKEAVEWGLVNRAVPAAELEETVLRMARKFARIHPELLRINKLSNTRVAALRGFRTAFLQGAEWVAMSDFAPALAEIRQLVQEKGMKAAIAELSGE